MPNSNFEMRYHQLNSEVAKCTCGQTFDFVSEGDWNMKLRMHHKFCPKPPESSKQVKIPMKGITLREQQHNEWYWTDAFFPALCSSSKNDVI